MSKIISNKSRLLSVVVAVSFFSGCATSPDKMQAAYVSPLKYKSYDCEQLVEERENVSRHEQDLYRTLKKEADKDAAQMGVGLVLFWPALFFLEGGDGPQAAEYSRLKGDERALEGAAVQKKCSQDIVAKLKTLEFTGKKVSLHIKGTNDGERTSMAVDRAEAIDNAKLVALSKAGFSIDNLMHEEDLVKRHSMIEDKSSQIIVPGYKINDKGYQKNGTYLVILNGKAFEVRS